MTTWLVVLGAALCTYLLRTSMIVVFAGREVPPALESRLRLAAPAVLAAMIAGSLFVTRGAVHGAPVGHLAALVAAAVVVRRTGKTIHALAVGLPVAWLAAAVGLA